MNCFKNLLVKTRPSCLFLQRFTGPCWMVNLPHPLCCWAALQLLVSLKPATSEVVDLLSTSNHQNPSKIIKHHQTIKPSSNHPQTMFNGSVPRIEQPRSARCLQTVATRATQKFPLQSSRISSSIARGPSREAGSATAARGHSRKIGSCHKLWWVADDVCCG